MDETYAPIVPVSVDRRSTPSDPAADMELTGAMLQAVATGAMPATARVFRPGPTAAFGRLDTLLPGFARARTLVAASGYVPVVRHAGGHVVLYDQDSVIVEVLQPESSVIGGLEQRYNALSALIGGALAGLGIELELGELDDEYCAGRFSLHLPDGPKIVGSAQRAIRRASLATAVVTVAVSARLRSLMAGVYAALEIPLDVRTLGGTADLYPEISADLVADAIAARLGQISG